ncbi:MAG: DUF2520 domain-containing protein [Rikenellaceae bacterium]
MIRVVIIGSGAVAEAMAKAVRASDRLHLVAVAGRNKRKVNEVAAGEAEAITDLARIPLADIYIVSVSDAAIEQVVRDAVFAEGSTVVHTAGSISVDILKDIDNKGVIYPMQSFSPGREINFRDVPLFIEGESKVVEIVANELSDNVLRMRSEERIDLHLAAVFASNFVNAMFGAAYDILKRNGVDFELYKPLIEETIAKVMANRDPHDGQSGPAKRGDEVTMDRHLQRLSNNQSLSEIYRVISSYITAKHRDKDGKL